MDFLINCLAILACKFAMTLPFGSVSLERTSMAVTFAVVVVVVAEAFDGDGVEEKFGKSTYSDIFSTSTSNAVIILVKEVGGYDNVSGWLDCQFKYSLGKSKILGCYRYEGKTTDLSLASRTN